MRLGEHLIERKVISLDDLDRALAIQANDPKTLIGNILLSMGVLTRADLVGALDDHANELIEWGDEDGPLKMTIEEYTAKLDDLETSIKEQQKGRAMMTRPDSDVVKLDTIIADTEAAERGD